ncbi:Crp/Fnr family transcriptional regulator [Dorea acetigenes]|jgi:CRP-like cAMP-binding protein|uniref:Crp/Fnr family transcriptional regulator n=1 Tax=Dorea acetigenes TaxID=2981787 RepID=A0ABT2RN61_9FIRM|nr:Crp/Fnr family transcriptional regulator [Dorea acetigenes]MCB6413535.1 Crp/Fnr family transcriptional regulator [Faecalimonas umbilicata]MCU6686599.1 Crp/Fnr family transcriptional regulator [Dorea acetigenes]SCJ02424.1 Fumarate and nitrate reduction regulatory protein [uncultured Clostridium sp.]
MELHKGLFSCHLFQGMDSEKAENIIRLLKGKTKEYQKKEMILSEGDEIREIGILLSGEVCKVQYYPDGTEQMMQKLQRSYMVGLEVAVSIKKTSPYTLYALQPSVIYWFPVRYIEEAGVLQETDRISLYQRIVTFLANEDIRKYRKIEILSSRSVREKIEKYLKIQSLRYQSDAFDIDFNREQLASYLGLNRSVLSHELKKMEKEGLLTVRKNHFVLY